jgi:hypothetical protein
MQRCQDQLQWTHTVRVAFVATEERTDLVQDDIPYISVCVFFTTATIKSEIKTAVHLL